MRSLLLPLLLILAAGCSQNPHVDVSSQPQKSNAGAAETTPDPKVVDGDGDGVPDAADQCPDEPGPAENNGCPYPKWQDHDADGTPDAEDRCPAVPGPAENQGCPWPEGDSDHDGVPDKYDRCPNVPGQIYNDGCPLNDEKDSDGDGVPDSLDKCPTVPGQIYNDGCPLREKDTDHDGVPNARDACPRVPGPACNRGCPYPKEEERRVLLEVKESLKFDFDKATIKASSFPALERLARFMEKYPASRLKMVGHTDDVGTDEYNQGLSEARVYSVKDYLKSHGIADSRIHASARGENEPLVSVQDKEDYELEEARAQNRRVDMSVRYVEVVR